MECGCANCRLARMVNGESVSCLDPDSPLVKFWLRMRGVVSDLPEVTTVYNCDTGKFKLKSVLISEPKSLLKGFTNN